MPQAADLRRLSQWCSHQGLSWMPGASVGATSAVMLVRPEGLVPAGMIVTGEGEEWHLLDDHDEVVAVASSLGLLLDAANAGFESEAGAAVAEPETDDDAYLPFDWIGARQPRVARPWAEYRLAA